MLLKSEREESSYVLGEDLEVALEAVDRGPESVSANENGGAGTTDEEEEEERNARRQVVFDGRRHYPFQTEWGVERQKVSPSSDGSFFESSIAFCLELLCRTGGGHRNAYVIHAPLSLFSLFSFAGMDPLLGQ